jgi:hypothetical protein
MPCNIIEGFYLGCNDGTGGVKAIYFTEFSNVASITSSSGTISSISMNSGKKFYLYECPPEVAEASQKGSFTVENGTTFYEQSITFNMYKLTAKNRNILRNLIQNKLMAIIQLEDDTYILFGEKRGIYVTSHEDKTGKAMGDHQGSVITLTGKEPLPANVVTSISGLT